MAYAILRIKKLTSREAATAATLHNYRGRETPNADPELFARNLELFNIEQRHYWDLATERIAELQLSRQRKDAVRAVEIILTASPEAFDRDQQGRAIDMRESQWFRDNVAFLQATFGKQNVVSCVLHQDEYTPHIHAIIIPITSSPRLVDGQPVGAAVRLSCRDVFSPERLRQLQTEYAAAMAPHNMERGVKYSSAFHQDVHRYNGAQRTSKEELAQLVTPVVYQPGEAQPKAWHVDKAVHLQRELSRVTEQAAEQVAALNTKLTEVGTIATANTLARDQVRVVEKMLATSKQHQERTAAALAEKTQELAAKTQELAALQQKLEQLQVRTAQGELLPSQTQAWATQQQVQSRERAEGIVATCLQERIARPEHLHRVLEQHGYTVSSGAAPWVREQSTQVLFRLGELRPNGEELAPQLEQAIERTRRQDIERHERAKEALQQQEAERVREQRWEQVSLDPHALEAVIKAKDDKQAQRMQEALEKAGAVALVMPPQDEQGVVLRVRYHFDWQTIHDISRVLDRVQQATGAQLAEEAKDQHQRNYAIRTLAQERGSSNELER